MDLYRLMENRKSTREFSTKSVSTEKLDKILKAGQMAPSGANQKPYVFIVVNDSDTKEKIKECCEKADKKFFENSEERFKKWMEHRKISLEKKFILDAPSLIVVAGEQDKPYWLESTWISIAYMTLAIENEGLKTLTYTPGEVGFLNEILDISSNLKPVVILPIGYPKSK